MPAGMMTPAYSTPLLYDKVRVSMPWAMAMNALLHAKQGAAAPYLPRPTPYPGRVSQHATLSSSP